MAPIRRKNRVIQQQPDHRANRTILLRTLLLLIIFGIAAFLPLFVKLYEIQITKHDDYLGRAIDQQTRDSEVTASRGTIYDCNGAPLAMSYTVHNIQLSPYGVQELQDKYEDAVEKAREKGTDLPDYPEPTDQFIAEGLAALLEGVEPEDVIKHMENRASQYEIIKWRVEQDEEQAVREFISENHLTGGIFVMPTTKRYYPKGSLASHVVGWVNYSNDGKGAYGMEAMYEEELAGETGRVVTAKNGRGTEMLYRFEDYYDATDGSDLYLTINSNIQYYCEKVLEKGVEMFEVQNGAFAIAMDPKTGAILAWASSPSYDLNRPREIVDPVLSAYLEQVENDQESNETAYKKALEAAQLDQWRDKIVNETYEPGSTFKAIVLAAALEEGVVSESDHFYCTGVADVEGWNGDPIKCSNRSGHKDQDLAKAVANSCNPAFISIGQRLGAQKFYDYLEDFGMLTPTGIDILGESKINPVSSGIMWSREKFTGVDLAVASFGQRFKITPIQLLTGVAAVVNGGHLMQPYVVSDIIGPDGSVIKHVEPTEVRQVISEQTSERCRTILEGVVDGGTGKNAHVEGYRIGGKTGSSQTGEADHTIVSFVGFAPADDPQVIILLAYDNPKPSGPNSNVTAGDWYISGGIMAAKMAGELMEDILEELGVEKSYTAQASVLVPNAAGLDRGTATQRMEEANLTVRTVGDGDTVTGQIPVAGASIPGGSQVVLYMGEDVPTDLVEVPSVAGKSAEGARQTLESAGLYMRPTGATEFSSGTVALSQAIAAGTQVPRGTVVEVDFIDNNSQGGASSGL